MEVTQLCRLSAFQLAEMDQLGSNGIMKVTTTLILYTNHAKLLLCCARQEEKFQYIEFHVFLHCLIVCYGKSIYYFAVPMTDTTAIFVSVTSHRLDSLSWIHLRHT